MQSPEKWSAVCGAYSPSYAKSLSRFLWEGFLTDETHQESRLLMETRLSRPIRGARTFFGHRMHSPKASVHIMILMRKTLLASATLAFVCLAQPAAKPVPAPPKMPELPDWVGIEANIHYDKHNETVLDVMWPKKEASGKRPGVLVIHGGGWTGGTKESQVMPMCMPYLEKGFVVANVEYRLAKAALAAGGVTDSLDAAELFRKNAKEDNVDPKRIVVTGGSAGGHLSLMVGMTPKSARLGPPAKVAAVVNFYGITDVG